ncbi:hypothetical protein DFJ58DRAFT_835374 [Suillus subalutaceus]|uniref:uncharacterized protein n=1 Tax=Suillus subalutaceus TaxID=48586 RepID=UPI001B85DB61|nr:uncharacterized protein DFJ58DRAFT_835374 [Suillus subalutaceus]KAG1877637.1 hypothetical protein DFJ58DRAFT_835374 [Suillus subalutaceus]
MAPPTKYSAKQIELMQTFHDQFLESWGGKFPERAVVFPDIPLDVNLTEEQLAVLSKAWALRQQRLMEKFRNDLGGSKSEEVKEEVFAAVEAMKEKRCTEIEEAKKQNHDKEVIHSYISKIAVILSQFFEELHEMTNWVFTVLMGGPHPAAGGTLDISSFHIGTTKLGNWFSQAYPQFSQNIMVPYTQFIEHVFSDAAALLRAKSLLPAFDTSSTLVITPGPSSAHLASDILPSTPLNTGTTATSDTLFSSELLNLMEGVDTFRFSSEPYASLPLMDTDNDTLQLSLPILPMPPQLLSQLPHETSHSLNQFLWDPSPEDFAQRYLSPISTSPLRIWYEIQNTLILTGDESATNSNEAGAQPPPYYTTDPTFVFPNSTPPPSQAHSTHILSATTPPAAPASTPPTQTPTSPSDAAPIGHPSDTGKKHRCESEEWLNVPVKRQKINRQIIRMVEANINGSNLSVPQKLTILVAYPQLGRLGTNECIFLIPWNLWDWVMQIACFYADMFVGLRGISMILAKLSDSMQIR